MSELIFMGYLKGKSAMLYYDRHLEFERKWSKALRACGYYVATIGNFTEEAIKDNFKNRVKKEE